MSMKSYASFDLWMKDQSKSNQNLIRPVRALIRSAAPHLEEAVKWGNGCFMGKTQGVIWLYSAADHLQYGFFYGNVLKDPEGRLEGKGQYIRCIKIRKPSDIDKTYFKYLLDQAVRLETTQGRMSLKKSKVSAAFPESLSRPAISALLEAKITSLKKLSAFTEKQTLALHGLGPKAMPILRAALKKEGLAFKEEEVAATKKKAATTNRSTTKKAKVVKKKVVKKVTKKSKTKK